MEKQKPLLRFEFVGMLFALAIGQVAIEFVDVYNSQLPFINWYYSFSHLVLATLIIAMSWIGWQSSKSLGYTVTITSIFSLPFLILLIDISLVIIYYLIANGNEKYLVDQKVFETPSVDSEILWVFLIFILYVFWDVITKIISIKYVRQTNGNYMKKYIFSVSSFKRILITLSCLIISAYFLIRYKDVQLLAIQALIVNINLLLIFVLFRGLKQSYKKNYDLDQTQIPDPVIQDSGIIFTTSINKINIEDNKIWRKVKLFLFRILPIILMIILELINHFCL